MSHTGEDLARGSASRDEGDEQRAPRPESGSPELRRAYRVESDEVIGCSLRELNLTHRIGCIVALLHRGGETQVPTADTLLQRGDRPPADEICHCSSPEGNGRT